jgi:tetratricopeptide (TPR) repeat protein
MKWLRCLVALGALQSPLLAASEAELPDPDLTALESTVAEQLSEIRELAQSVVHNQLASAADKAKVWGEMGQLYHAYGLLDAAEACYTKVEELDPENPDWPYYRGHVAMAAGDVAAAVAHFARVLELRPGDLAALVYSADLQLQQGDGDAARALLERAADDHPSSTVVGARLGELDLAQGRYEEAVRLLTAVLAAEPAATRLNHALGMAYRELGDMEHARFYLERRGDVGLAPADPLLDELQGIKVGERVHLLRGRRAFSAGQFEQAAEEFRLAIEAAPESARARINLGAALAGLNDIAGALRELQQAVALAPDNPTARFNLATLLASLGEHRLAIVHFQAATAARPGDEDAWLGEARSWIALDDFAQAAARLEVAAAKVPDSGPIAFGLARLLAAAPDLAVRDGERALDLARRVFEAQKSVDHAILVAQALREQGRCDDARTWLDGLIAEGEAGSASAEVEALEAERSLLGAADPCRP